MSFALDLVGDRWSMLIIRDLLFGPLRYTDLKEGLPGIASNLLADRLRSLEEAGVVQKTHLPPPAAADVYELTERGQGLQKVVGALFEWGMSLLPVTPPDDFYVGFAPLQGYLRAGFSPALAGDMRVTGQFQCGDLTFVITIADRSLSIYRGTDATADFTMSFADLRILAELLNRAVTLTEAVTSGAVSLQGETAKAQDLLRPFVFDQLIAKDL